MTFTYSVTSMQSTFDSNHRYRQPIPANEGRWSNQESPPSVWSFCAWSFRPELNVLGLGSGYSPKSLPFRNLTWANLSITGIPSFDLHNKSRNISKCSEMKVVVKTGFALLFLEKKNNRSGSWKHTNKIQESKQEQLLHKSDTSSNRSKLTPTNCHESQNGWKYWPVTVNMLKHNISEDAHVACLFTKYGVWFGDLQKLNPVIYFPKATCPLIQPV